MPLLCFSLYTKSARINPNIRITMLLVELEPLNWNFIYFSETRCLTKNIFIQGGHRLIASLNQSEVSGVAVLINRRFVKFIIKKILVSDRVMAVDIRFGKRCIRLIAVYMPHAGYPWANFELCMSDIEAIAIETLNQNYHIAIAGDFNLSL